MKLFDVYNLLDLTFQRAQMEFIWDDKNQKYLDFYGGHAVISIGHTHLHFVQKITQQLNQIAFFSNSVHIQQQQELAQLLGVLSDLNDYRLFLCNSGAEANENALKVASFQTGKDKVIAFRGGFHGRTSGAVAVTDNSKIRAPFNTHHRVEFIGYDLNQLEEALASNDVAAIIFEAIQGVGGVRYPQAGFWEEMQSLARKHGALLIADEVQTGYGRTGKFFAFQHHNLQPDIVSMAKGMGNGFPIGGILVSPDIHSEKGMLGTTFGGNHLACAAGIAVLEVIQRENLIQQAADRGDEILQFLKLHSKANDIRGKGLIIGLDYESEMKDIKSELLNRHHILCGQSGVDTLRLLPPLSIGLESIEYFKEKLIETEENVLV